MAATLREYAAWLDDRKLLWPAAPQPVPVKATPAVHPLAGIKAVTWELYGTLLVVSDGQLYLQHPQAIRMQVALEKTIQEFNMWNSMTRKAGAPWEYLLPKYAAAIEERRMTSSGRKGDFTEVNAADVWRKLLGMLEQKDYQYDEKFYGDLDELSEKIAFFFQRCLQGVGAAPGAVEALQAVTAAGRQQGLLADGQPFSVVQMLRALEQQSKLPPLAELFAPGCVVLSFQEGIRKPSPSLYQKSLQQFERLGISAGEILHVGTRLQDDLAVAKRLGMRTALYAGDKSSLQASAAELKDPALKPDRLLTELGQIRQILAAA